jgi:hypothetical protein
MKTILSALVAVTVLGAATAPAFAADGKTFNTRTVFEMVLRDIR